MEQRHGSRARHQRDIQLLRTQEAANALHIRRSRHPRFAGRQFRREDGRHAFAQGVSGAICLVRMIKCRLR